MTALLLSFLSYQGFSIYQGKGWGAPFNPPNNSGGPVMCLSRLYSETFLFLCNRPVIGYVLARSSS